MGPATQQTLPPPNAWQSASDSQGRYKAVPPLPEVLELPPALLPALTELPPFPWPLLPPSLLLPAPPTPLPELLLPPATPALPPPFSPASSSSSPPHALRSAPSAKRTDEVATRRCKSSFRRFMSVSGESSPTLSAAVACAGLALDSHRPCTQHRRRKLGFTGVGRHAALGRVDSPLRMPTPVRPRRLRWLRAADPSQIAGQAGSGRGNSRGGARAEPALRCRLDQCRHQDV